MRTGKSEKEIEKHWRDGVKVDAGWKAAGWNVTHAELLGLGLVPGRDHWIRRCDMCVCVYTYIQRNTTQPSKRMK